MRFSPVVLAMSIVTAVYCTAYFGFTASVYISLFILWIIISLINRRMDIASLIIMAAAVAGSISYVISSSELIHKSIGYINREVVLTGVTASSAQESGSNYRYIFFVKSVTENNTESDINDTVMLTTPCKLRCGESITVKGMLKDFGEQMNENGFDMAGYYKSQNIFARIYSEDISGCEPVTVITPSVLCGKFREWVDGFIYRYYYGDGAAVLSAVLTGNNHHFSDDFNKVLSRTAFRHLYHPPHLHILIISMLAGLFTGFVPKKARTAGQIVILLAYAMLNCAQVGFTRCIITFAVTLFLKTKNGSSYYPDTIAWIITAVAVFMPTMLFNAVFILSVSAGVIVWAFMPYFIKRLKWLPGRIRHTAAAIAVFAFVYTPVSQIFFNGICIYTLLMPFITIPLVLLILITAPVVFAMLSVFGTALPVKPYLDSAILILLRLPEVIYKLPMSRIITPTPSPAGALLIISLVFVFYYYINKKKLRQYIFTTLAAGFAISLAVTSVLRIGTTDFIFVNVGQGDGAVIHTAYKSTVLIDGGGGSEYSEYNPGEEVYLPYLESKGYRDIEAAFISHMHRDHTEGIIAAIENLRVRNVFVPSPEADWDEDMLALMAKTEKAASENGTILHYITENLRLNFDSGLTVSVYAPNDAVIISDDGNDSSLLIRAEYGNTNALYTGDMTAFAESEYIKRGIDLSSDILKVAHHGSANSTHPEWVKAVNPAYAVISCGADNSYGHPRPQTLKNLKGIPLLRTDKDGDIKITADKNGIRKITTLK